MWDSYSTYDWIIQKLSFRLINSNGSHSFEMWIYLPENRIKLAFLQYAVVVCSLLSVWNHPNSSLPGSIFLLYQWKKNYASPELPTNTVFLIGVLKRFKWLYGGEKTCSKNEFFLKENSSFRRMSSQKRSNKEFQSMLSMEIHSAVEIPMLALQRNHFNKKKTGDFNLNDNLNFCNFFFLSLYFQLLLS